MNVSVNSMKVKLRRGIVLGWALVTMAVTTTLLGVMASYYVGVGRFAQQYRDGTEKCFAQQNITDEEMTSTLSTAADLLNQALAAQPADVGFDKLVETLKTALTAQKFKAVEVGGSTVYQKVVNGQTLTVASPDQLMSQSGKKRKLNIEATFSSGGVPITLRQEMTFVREKVSVLVDDDSDVSDENQTSDPSFDYVYFVNNYGHLESDYLIVNGNVHSNDRMTIDKATVNGYVSTYSNTITVTNGKIWPAETYQVRVGTEWGRTLTQVRPIDGTPFPWEGGYIPPLLLCPFVDDYSTIEPPPSVKEPTWPGKMPTFDEPVPQKSYYTPTALVCTETTEGSGLRKKTYYQWSYTYMGEVKSSSKVQGLIAKEVQRELMETSRKKDAKNGETEYRNALANYQSLSNTYATVTLAPWNEYYAKMEQIANHTTPEEQAWNSRKEIYDGQRNAWQTDLANGVKVVDLDGAMSVTGEKIVNDKGAYVDMLDLSRPDRYKDYCMRHHGSLQCRNCFKNENGVDTRIAWKNPSQVDVVYLMVRVYKGGQKWTDWYLDESASNVGLGQSIWTESSPHPLKRELSEISIISNGYQASVYPFRDYNNPCSYSATFSCSGLSLGGKSATAQINYGSVPADVMNMECGSVILIGTYDYPIIINGPVYFDGDVVIRGYVSGQGSIYSGRNIHIIGDIVYRKPSGSVEYSYCGTKYNGPPAWPYDSTGAGSKTKLDFVSDSAKSDLLLLAARGNIIVGDYTSAEWQKASNMKWLKCPNGVSPVGNTYEDSIIGYSSGHNNYTVFDRGMKVDLQRMTTPYTKPLYYSSYFKDAPIIGSWDDQKWYYGEMLHATNLTNRAFYQCTLGDHVINGLKQKGDGSDFSSISPVDYNNAGMTRDGFIVPAASKVKATVKANTDAADITQIDSILFAGHGIFGVVGGTYGHKFTLNGALICRDEGLFPSFETRFASATQPEPRIWLNWDMRIKSDTDGGNPIVGLNPDPVDRATETTRFDIFVSDWQQVR